MNAQTKINNMVVILQDQRNSALDALVTNQAEHLTTLEKLKEVQTKFETAMADFQSMQAAKTNLEFKLKEKEEKILELEKINLEIQESLTQLKEASIPKLKKKEKSSNL